MEKREFNGFASEEQYEAVHNVIEGITDEEVFDLSFNEDSYCITIDAYYFKCTIVGPYMIDIYADDFNALQHIADINDSTDDIWDAFENTKAEVESNA